MPVDIPCEEGTIVVIDGAGVRNLGCIGSNNIMRWVSRGARGVVTNVGCRDSDEITFQKIPVYAAYIGQGRKIGRVELDQYNVPVSVGGVLVRPNDLILGDGDGVIVVPIEYWEQVAELAGKEYEEDLRSRRQWYQRLHCSADPTIQ